MLLALRAAGEQLGWGFQLQSPAVVTALAVLFFVLALNLSGVFEFGVARAVGSGRLAARIRSSMRSLSGVLAVVIASPCTAPFMGAALGFALAQPAALTLLVFVALGVGMALPFLLLSWFPGWRRMLPRPGAWMVRLKQLLAFPLYATVAWLVLGAGRAGRQRRGAAPAGDARRRRVRAVGVARVSRRRRRARSASRPRWRWPSPRSSSRGRCSPATPAHVPPPAAARRPQRRRTRGSRGRRRASPS